MKKLTLLVALGAMMAFAGCSKDQISSSEQENNAVAFKSEIGNAESKGIEIPAGILKQNFGVWASYQTSPNPNTFNANLMNNTKITYAPGGYSYVSTVYWPNNSTDKIFFDAYAPYNPTGVFNLENITSVSTLSTGFPTISFKVANTFSLQEDLVVAKTGALSSGVVNLKFTHALTKVGFQAKLKENYKNAEVVITEVKILDALNSGTYDFHYQKWTNGTTKSSYILTDPSGLTLKNNKYCDFGGKLLLMPQKTDNLKLQVTYHMVQNGAAGTSSTKYFSLNKKDWTPNSCIIYQICFTLNAVEFTTCVYDWDCCDFVEAKETFKH